VLARKPGALRNGAPFKDWLLPANLERVRRKLRGADDGDRQMLAILSAVLTDGLAGVEAACAEALADNVHSADVVLNILARKRDPGPAVTILTPDALLERRDRLVGHSALDRAARGHPKGIAQELATERAGHRALGLVDREAQPAVEPPQQGHHPLACLPAADIDVRIVGIAHEAMASAFQLLVHVIEQDVRQQRRQRTALRRPHHPLLDHAIHHDPAV